MLPGPSLVEPRSGRPRPSPRVLATLVAAATLVLGLVLALAWRPTPQAPLPSGMTAESPSGGAASPTLGAYDADGVPRSLDGEPVLRGSAIVDHARSGDASPFVVAGWHTNDPTPSCAPTKYHCGYTSLADGPWRQETGSITLDRPAGTQFSFDATGQWVGGFYVLRVRPACSYFSGLCLVVDDVIEPPGDLPGDASGFDADGLPRTVDGQPVLRGPDVAARLASNTWDAGPLYVAGQVETAAPSKYASCPDLVTWDAHPCPAIRLADPGRGQPFDASAPRLEAARWSVRQAWDPALLWPGGYVVVRADRGFVLGFIMPREAHPEATQAPMPSMQVSSWGYNARVVEVEGRRVAWGPGVSTVLARVGSASFMVTGVVRDKPCDLCAGGTIPTLLEPSVRGSRRGATAYPLLRADGSPFALGKAMVWTEPPGVVVLEVRHYAGACPPGVDCTEALEVLSVATILPFP